MKAVIRDIEKNSREVVRVAIDEFNGRPLVAIRQWFRPDSGDELRPTAKGINVSVKHLPELAAALAEAEARARAEGLLT